MIPPSGTTPAAHRARPALGALIEALSNPNMYPGNHGSVEVRQTHASAVFLTQHDVYKLKKPVNPGFLDYSTLRRRAVMCRREVELNQRLAPSVYFGVERLVRRPDGELAIGGSGETIDYLVHMRRLPDEDSLDAMIQRGAAGHDEMRQVARRIAHFHAAARVAPSSFSFLRTLTRNAADNIACLNTQPGAWLSHRMASEVTTFTDEALAALRPLLAERERSGRVRDGHGDLRGEHVYLHDGRVEIIDCIEFNRRYRYMDVALDLAFLAMDLRTSGYPDLARALTDEYEGVSSESLRQLLPFFCSYRAMVRCKTALIRSTEAEFGAAERDHALLEAARYLYSALVHARGEARPLLAVVCGLTGTGKSTTARLIAEVLPASVVGADEVRKRLAGLTEGQHVYVLADEGLYSPAMNARVYGSLRARASEALALGRPIILDATYRRRTDRVAIHELARKFDARLLVIECTAPEEIIRARLNRRIAAGGDRWSDASWDTYVAQRAAAEPFDELNPAEYLRLDTELPPLDQARRVLEHLAHWLASGESPKYAALGRRQS